MEQRLSRFHLFPVVAIIAAVCYYWRFLDNFFAYDDFKYLENMYSGWSDVLIGYGSLRLISNLSWWPLFEICGFDPFGYNLFALIIFTLNAILLYFLLVRLLPDRVTAFLAAAFFVTGSAGVDAVFWKATDSSLISLFFYLSSLICYTDYRRSGERRRYFLSIALFFAAMFSKEEAASLPFMVALIDIFFFEGLREKRRLILRLLPFCAVVLFYLMANAFVFNYLLGGRAEPQKLFSFRPLHSLAGGFTVFFLSPDGFLRLNSSSVYMTALFMGLSLMVKPTRRLLVFGYLWIFLAFLPQSFTILGQFQPRVIVNSISRYLYITSIGSSVVFAAVLAGMRGVIPSRWWYVMAGMVLLLFVRVHYPEVRVRGQEWQSQGADVREFIAEVKQVMPSFPAPCQVHVVNAPTGRAFVQQAMRAFYGNPQIHWVNSVEEATEEKGPLFLIHYRRLPGIPVQVVLVR